jgi:putative addiction module component (TIGR02574 family)
MSDRQKALLAAVLELPEGERMALVERVLDSIDRPADPAVEAAWLEEIARRREAIRSGDARLVPHDEAMARVTGRT